MRRVSIERVEMKNKDKVRFFKTPDAILQKQLEIYDTVADKKASENPLFKEIVEFAEGVCGTRGGLGHGQQRQPPHGLQPLLRPPRRGTCSGSEEGLISTARETPCRIRHGVSFFILAFCPS